MGIEIVDGVLEPAQPSGTKRGYARFKVLRIALPGGKVQDYHKVSTAEPVTSEVMKGGEGRFYFTTTDGPLGMFGVRRPDGAAHYAHFSNVEKLLLVVGGLASIGSVARFGFGVAFPLLGAVLGPLMLVGWFYLDGKRKAALRAFEADAA